MWGNRQPVDESLSPINEEQGAEEEPETQLHSAYQDFYLLYINHSQTNLLKEIF